jgi:hypothetical protein
MLRRRNAEPTQQISPIATQVIKLTVFIMLTAVIVAMPC